MHYSPHAGGSGSLEGRALSLAPKCDRTSRPSWVEQKRGFRHRRSRRQKSNFGLGRLRRASPRERQTWAGLKIRVCLWCRREEGRNKKVLLVRGPFTLYRAVQPLDVDTFSRSAFICALSFVELGERHNTVLNESEICRRRQCLNSEWYNFRTQRRVASYWRGSSVPFVHLRPSAKPTDLENRRRIHLMRTLEG